MRKFSFLVAGLLMVSTAFAAERPVTKFTIKVKGKTIVTALMSDMPLGSDLVVSTDRDGKTVYNNVKRLTTVTGKSKVEVRQGEKTIFKMAIENGVVEIEQGDVAEEK